MARTHARLFCSIWNDPVFTALSVESQRLYLLALSQPNISLCGVVPWTPKRWARFSPESKADDLEHAVVELENAGLVLLDQETEELWVKSFVRYDGILGNSKLEKGMRDALSTVLSPQITAGHVEKYGLPESQNHLGIAHPENEREPESISGFSSALTTPTSMSSSSSPLVVVVLEREVANRLRGRRGDAITNLDQWKRKVRAEILKEWGDKGLEERIAAEQERRACEACVLCDDAGRVELIQGTLSRCAHPDVEREAG